MDSQTISIDDFELLRVVGKGTYGRVLLVRKRDTQELLAMKILKKRFIHEKNQVEHTLAERNILEKISHPYIVKLRYAFQSAEKLYFVLEYCPGGELFFHLSRSGRFEETRACFYAACIVLSLDHLHRSNIIYRDLKPENVLIDAEGFVKITDFGLSKENILDGRTAKTLCGTPEYLAPEILLKQGHGKAVDWWSLGCLIYEMLVGLPPYYVEDRRITYRKILSEDVYFPEFVSPVAKHLMQGLLNKDPNQRLGSSPHGAGEVKDHAWFSRVNWDCLTAKQASPPFVPVFRDPTDARYFSPEFTESSVQERSDLAISCPSNDSLPFVGFSYNPNSELMSGDPDIVMFNEDQEM